jgi:hypothetical protein
VSGFVPGSQAAELHRDVFTVLAHDLGGIASSLALRADALAAVLPGADHAALSALAEEVRDINRVLRLIRGPQGTDALAPGRNMPVAQWWRFVARLTNAILPRGAVVHATLEAAPLSPLQASTLSHLWLAACKDLTWRGLQPPCDISLTVTPRDEPGEGATLVAELPAGRWPAPRASRSASRWFRYSARLARLNGAELQWWTVEGDAARWLCSIGAR